MQSNSRHPITFMKTKNLKIDERIHALLKRTAKRQETHVSSLGNRILAEGLKPAKKLSLPVAGMTHQHKTESPRAGSKQGRGEGKP